MNQEAALRELQTEQTKYFDAIKLHPRMLVGQEVPSINGEGMETLRDSKDAQDWQEAVKSVLVAELRDRVGRAMEDWFYDQTEAGRTILAARAAIRDSGAKFPIWFYMVAGHR